MQLTLNEVGLSHPRVATILNNIALVYDDMNDKKAGDLFKGVLNIMVQAYGQNHVDVAVVRYNLGAFLFANNLYERSRYQFNEAQRIFELFLGNDHPDTRLTEVALEKLHAFVK
ncbi:kinesin light chain 1-like [Anneissia japonica]|uniref:kinesin light chain 1-like n=1 Tax=Anneissia japonica TaxID=1529436 RepID=UPI001425AF80|nr:kinesin light chain 1-like [Anneissia japonica]